MVSVRDNRERLGYRTRLLDRLGPDPGRLKELWMAYLFIIIPHAAFVCNVQQGRLAE